MHETKHNNKTNEAKDEVHYLHNTLSKMKQTKSMKKGLHLPKLGEAPWIEEARAHGLSWSVLASELGEEGRSSGHSIPSRITNKTKSSVPVGYISRD